MIIKGILIAESPIYRGNARKTLFTRDNDGREKLVSLAGEISGTASALMDAFIGESRNRRNSGLLNLLWQRLYGSPMNHRLIRNVSCTLKKEHYSPDHFFDLRMGIRLDEDRWAAEANANYKLETLFKGCAFNFSMEVDDKLLAKDQTYGRLYYLLKELEEGRFWFGAGKTKGLGRCRLVLDTVLDPPEAPPAISSGIDHLTVDMVIDASNPLLIGWNWGKVDKDSGAVLDTNGKFFLSGLENIPSHIRKRLALAIGGRINNLEKWKQKLGTALARALSGWVRQHSASRKEVWILPAAAMKKLGKGKKAVSKKVLALIEPMVDKPYSSREEAEAEFQEILGAKAKKSRRVLDALQQDTVSVAAFNAEEWRKVASMLGIPENEDAEVASCVKDPARLEKTILTLLEKYALSDMYSRVDQMSNMLNSDVWVNDEIASRQEHLNIKRMLMDGRIKESQWGNPRAVPDGVKESSWREFLKAHQRVQYRYMLNRNNLMKSIVNDENMIEFLKNYRDKARVELARPENMDFRKGGRGGRDISKAYGKPFDTVFMRMFRWIPAAAEKGKWEVYIPGSTIKGAFRKRAAMVLKTLWGDNRDTAQCIDALFGKQGQAGCVYFSDAYLVDPERPELPWRAMDGVKMDAGTGGPLEEAKQDYLFAYGRDFRFRLRIDLTDMSDIDSRVIDVFMHLLADFTRGDIVIGGEKTNGFGWVQASCSSVSCLTSGNDPSVEALFANENAETKGIWNQISLEGEKAAAWIAHGASPLECSNKTKVSSPPVSRAGFVSHRAFGGYCGELMIEGKVLTPLHIREAGEPSWFQEGEHGRINGWNSFHLGPVAKGSVPVETVQYAIPSKTLRGLVRSVYSIASASVSESSDISRLNAADSLFGWVGAGQNQAISGRLVFNFGLFNSPELAWLKIPYPYGQWQWKSGRWENVPGARAHFELIAGKWRMFPHTPVAPCVEHLDEFQTDSVQADYVRALKPGAQFTTSIRFWNLEKVELQRLLWCIEPGDGFAHKLGKARYLGLGSVALSVTAESYLIDWAKRYSGDESWKKPLVPDEWRDETHIAHLMELRAILNADAI